MENLRDYIEKNRELFDDKEPPAGHAKRFEEMLESCQKQTLRPKRIHLLTILAVAASLALLIGIAVQFYHPARENIVPTKSHSAVVQDEFQATNHYYSQQMQAQIADIQCKLKHTDAGNQQQVKQDLQQLIENSANFVSEMATNNDKKMAVYYLTKHYEANIQALEDINEKLGRYIKC